MDQEKVKAMLAEDQYPVNSRENASVSKDRIWVDGCFDFSHHGILMLIVSARQMS